MHNFKWRKWAKAIAILQLIALAIRAILLIAAIAALAGLSSDKAKDKYDAPVGVLWAGCVLSAVFLGAGVWLAILLYNGTAEDLVIEEAYKKCVLWRNVSIVLAVLSCIGYGMQTEWIMLAVNLLVKIIFILLVQKFIKELQRASTSGPVDVVA